MCPSCCGSKVFHSIYLTPCLDVNSLCSVKEVGLATINSILTDGRRVFFYRASDKVFYRSELYNVDTDLAVVLGMLGCFVFHVFNSDDITPINLFPPYRITLLCCFRRCPTRLCSQSQLPGTPSGSGRHTPPRGSRPIQGSRVGNR